MFEKILVNAIEENDLWLDEDNQELQEYLNNVGEITEEDILEEILY